MLSAATLTGLRNVELFRPTRVCGGAGYTSCVEGDARLLSANVHGRLAIVNGKDAVALHGDAKVLRLGSIGSGPGEWRAIGAISLRDNGGVLIYDPILQRMTQYASDGDVIRSVLVNRPPSYHSAHISANALFLLTMRGEDQPEIGVSQHDLATGHAVGKVVTTSANASPITGETDLRPIPPFFSPRPFWDVTPGGVVVLSYGEDAVVEWITMKGSTTSAKLSIAADPVTKADIERERKRLLPATLPPAMEATVRPQVEAAARNARKVHQPVRAIVAASDGGVWVATRASSAAKDIWYRFNAEGIPEGQLMMPPADRLIWSDGQRIVTLTTASNKEPVVTIWSWRYASR